jgi:hypothetical protein
MGDEHTKPDRWQRLNQFALLLAFVVTAALGLAWWRDRARTFQPPRWEASRFVALPAPEAATRAAGGPAAATRASAERWVVAVSLACPHCQEHLRALAARTAARAARPSLTALIVDQPVRPAGLDLGVPLAGGAYWDSAQVWRERWGRRAYGETFRFDARGAFLSSTPAGVVPDSASVRM